MKKKIKILAWTIAGIVCLSTIPGVFGWIPFPPPPPPPPANYPTIDYLTLTADPIRNINQEVRARVKVVDSTIDYAKVYFRVQGESIWTPLTMNVDVGDYRKATISSSNWNNNHDITYVDYYIKARANNGLIRYRYYYGYTTSATTAQNNPKRFDVIDDFDNDGRNYNEEIVYQTDPQYAEPYWHDFEQGIISNEFDYTDTYTYSMLDSPGGWNPNDPSQPTWNGPYTKYNDYEEGTLIGLEDDDNRLTYETNSPISASWAYLGFDIAFSEFKTLNEIEISVLGKSSTGSNFGMFLLYVDGDGFVKIHDIPSVIYMEDVSGEEVQLTEKHVHRLEFMIDLNERKFYPVIDRVCIGRGFDTTTDVTNIGKVEFYLPGSDYGLFIDNFVFSSVTLDDLEVISNNWFPDLHAFIPHPDIMEIDLGEYTEFRGTFGFSEGDQTSLTGTVFGNEVSASYYWSGGGSREIICDIIDADTNTGKFIYTKMFGTITKRTLKFGGVRAPFGDFTVFEGDYQREGYVPGDIEYDPDAEIDILQNGYELIKDQMVNILELLSSAHFDEIYGNADRLFAGSPIKTVGCSNLERTRKTEAIQASMHLDWTQGSKISIKIGHQIPIPLGEFVKLELGFFYGTEWFSENTFNADVYGGGLELAE